MSIIFTLAVISTCLAYLLWKRQKKVSQRLGRADIALAICAIVGVVIGIPAAISEYQKLDTNLVIQFFLLFVPQDLKNELQTELQQGGIDWVALAFAVGTTVMLAIVAYLWIMKLFRDGWIKWQIKKFEAEILPEGKDQFVLGETVYFRAKFTGRLDQGFFEAQIKAPYHKIARVSIYRKNDDDPDSRGTLKRKIDNGTFEWMWTIPSDFTIGDYQIMISVFDTMSITHELKLKSEPLAVQRKTIHVSKLEKKVKILKISEGVRKGMMPFNAKELPANGWICVKIYNETDKQYRGCIGQVVTDLEQIELCDYEEYQVKGNLQQTPDLYNSFQLNPNESKRLYANIKTNDGKVRILLDLGEEELEQEFTLPVIKPPTN